LAQRYATLQRGAIQKVPVDVIADLKRNAVEADLAAAARVGIELPPEVIEEPRAQLAEGEVVLGFANVWLHPFDGELRVSLVLLEGSNPLVVLHEMAHALEIEADHGPIWAGHFEALLSERYQ
jgi:hypothetical protein